MELQSKTAHCSSQNIPLLYPESPQTLFPELLLIPRTILFLIHPKATFLFVGDRIVIRIHFEQTVLHPCPYHLTSLRFVFRGDMLRYNFPRGSFSSDIGVRVLMISAYSTSSSPVLGFSS
jgi:hypothetical protein